MMSTADGKALAGQVAVVTGGGRGIGASVAQRLAEMGASAVICGRSQQPLEETAHAITAAGGRCEVVPCDVTNLSSVDGLAARVQSGFGRLDILVNNSGVGGPDYDGPLHKMLPERWDEVLNTNLRGVFYCLRALVPMMIRAHSGHIINMSSMHGINHCPNAATYAASKWGLRGLTYAVAEELRDFNIRVSVVFPGTTLNSVLRPAMFKDSSRALTGADVAHVIAMLVTQAPQSFVSEIVLRPTRECEFL